MAPLAEWDGGADVLGPLLDGPLETWLPPENPPEGPPARAPEDACCAASGRLATTTAPKIPSQRRICKV
jgi:hypothetical protein